jgi:hypothetical protein
MKKTVENIDFEKAAKNKDYIRIMNKSSQRFSNQLDKDIIYSCQLTALWKAMQSFDESKNVKFTTFLYKGVFIECMKEIKIYNKGKKCAGKLHENIPQSYFNQEILELKDEVGNEEDFHLLIDRFVSRMTINEIAISKNTNREKIRKKINRIIEKLAG